MMCSQMIQEKSPRMEEKQSENNKDHSGISGSKGPRDKEGIMGVDKDSEKVSGKMRIYCRTS